MRRLIVLVALTMIVFGSAFAAQTFEPSPANLDDLDHSYFYAWGIDYSLPQGTYIDSASIAFNQIDNWENEPNVLFVNLLDDAAYGVATGYDGEAEGNYFEGAGQLLVSYTDDSTGTPVDFTWNFTAPQLTALNAALANGNFGIGFDPDCHFYNQGVKLTLNTNVVPEPFSAMLFVVGGGALAFLKKRKA